MKTKLKMWALALAVGSALILCAEEKEPEKAKYKFKNGAFLDSAAILTITPCRYISLACGKGQIQIDCQTGAIELPKDVPLDKAAIEFWKTVAKAFPEARRQIIEGEKKSQQPNATGEPRRQEP